MRRLKVSHRTEPGEAPLPDAYISIVEGRPAVQCAHRGVGDELASALVRYFVEGSGFPVFKKDALSGEHLHDATTGRLIADGHVSLRAPPEVLLLAIRDNLRIGGQYEVTDEGSAPPPVDGAGGPNAAMSPCMYCAGPADRTNGGLETDFYLCRDCGRTFGIDFDAGGPPREPLWPPARERVLAKLVLLAREGDGHESEFALGDEVTMGRHPECDVQILDRSVGKRHARITRRGDAFVLTDLGSPDGTFVGPRRVEGEHVLQNGDELRLGARRLLYVARSP